MHQRETLIGRVFIGLLFAFVLLVPAGQVLALDNPQTALDDYVGAVDPAYGFEHFASLPGAGYSAHVFSMTSQRWRSEDEVDRQLWSHWLAVIVPDTVATDTAMLMVAGGRNRDLPDLNAGELQLAAQIALASNSIVAVISQVPNQPLVFPDAIEPLQEDSLVAYSWDKAMDTGDFSWPVYLPMVKSVVRAMDTVQTVTPMVAEHLVEDFVIVGFSKRGAITWLSAVVDPRVRAISPGVIDFLNVTPHIEHHYRAYGFYAPAVQPYVDYNIVRRVRTPEGQDLLRVVDPYSYLPRLDRPKFLLNSTGDQFFPPDSARFYFKQLQGENLIRYVPNTDHSLSSPDGSVDDALASLLTWYAGILYDLPRPTVEWQTTEAGVTVVASPPPMLARLWRATNPEARDFRRDTIGAAWTSELVVGDSNGVFQMTVDEPENGWTAYYLELIYPGAGGLPQTYSSRVFVTPDTLPHELSDPLNNPKGKRFWKRQIRAAVTGHGHATVDAETLAGYFPIPVFDTRITSLDEAYALFFGRYGHEEGKKKWKDKKRRGALQQCLALRLNVAHSELGWYTSLEIDGEGDHHHPRKYHDKGNEIEGYLWQAWQRAHNAYLDGHPKQAKRLCKAINKL